MRARPVLPIALCAVLSVAGCGDVPPRLKEAPPLTASTACAVGGENVVGRPYRSPVATIVMNNDGGWCWMMSSESERGLAYGPYLKLIRPPQYGTVQIDVLETQTRVAYRPNPGFTGTDGFETRSMEVGFEVDYRVTVNR